MLVALPFFSHEESKRFVAMASTEQLNFVKLQVCLLIENETESEYKVRERCQIANKNGIYFFNWPHHSKKKRRTQSSDGYFRLLASFCGFALLSRQ